MHISDRFSFQKLTASRIQLLCMGLVALSTAYALPIGKGGDFSITYLSVSFLTATAVLFITTYFQKPLEPTAKLLLKIGGAFVIWLGILMVFDVLHYPSCIYYGPRFTTFVPLLEYLMLLPFAALRREEKRHWGLLFMGIAYCIGCTGLLIYFAMQLLNIVPEYLSQIIRRTTFEMRVAWGANIYACIFMIAIGFQLYFACLTKKRWLKILLILSLLPGFCAIALTQARAVVFLSACIAAATAFFAIFPGAFTRKNLLRLIIGLLVAVLILGILLTGMDELNRIRFRRLYPAGSSQSGSPRKTAGISASGESLAGGFRGRFAIINSTLKNIKAHPEILLFGLREGQEFTIYKASGRPTAHSHNAWIQALVRTGVIGLILALILTCIAIKNCFQLMFSAWASLPQKVIAVLIIGIMCAELFEPYLFFNAFPDNQINMVFLLCLGYVVYWVRDTRLAKVKAA